MPAVLRRTSFIVSRLRSSISFSVITVMDCGMSRSCWLPLPIVVVVARSESLPCASAFPFTVTGASVMPGVPAGTVWAQLPTEAASIMAPSGSSGGSDMPRAG